MQRRANPSWWGTADENFHVDPYQHVAIRDILEQFDEMIDIACTDGTWDFDPYLHGMANGMLFMRSMIDGKDPNYLEAPDRWGRDVPDDGLPPTEAEEYQAGFRCATVVLDPFVTALNPAVRHAGITNFLQFRGARYRQADVAGGVHFYYDDSRDAWVMTYSEPIGGTQLVEAFPNGPYNENVAELIIRAKQVLAPQDLSLPDQVVIHTNTGPVLINPSDIEVRGSQHIN